MENTKTKKKLKLWQRVLIIVLAVIVALVAALGITVGCVWGNEIATVSSFKKIFNSTTSTSTAPFIAWT